MNKAGILIGILGISLTLSLITIYSDHNNETVNLDMGRSHGTISTAMASPLQGNPGAPVTIVEFGDYQCRQCYIWYENTKPAITSDYVETGKVNFIFIDLAFLGNDSAKAAQASYCAEDQQMYWQYHDLLYSSQKSKIDGGWADTEELQNFAVDLGLDMDLFESCLDSGKYSKRVEYNIQQAHKNGITGTPGFFVVASNDQHQIKGAQPFSVFKQILDSMV